MVEPGLSPRSISTLTGLRFYMALAVLICHLYTFNYFCGNKQYAVFPYLHDIGFLGVSVFFVLSGFILYINYLAPNKQSFKPSQFYMARFARVYPALFTTLILAIPLQLLSHQLKGFGPAFLLNLTMMQAYHPIHWKSFNMPAWSVSNEWTFYLLFPLLALLFKRNPHRNFILIVLAFALYIVALTVFVPDSFYSEDRFPFNRLMEFALGMYGGYWYFKLQKSTRLHHWIQHSQARFWMHLALAALLGAMVMAPAILTTPWLTRHFNFLYYAVFALPLILLLALSEVAGKPLAGLSHPWAVLGGEISYSIYLLHHMFFRYIKRLLTLIFPKVWVSFMPPLAGVIFFPILLCLILTSAYWLYRYIEQPYRKRLLNWYNNHLRAKVQDLHSLQPYGKSLG